MANEERMVEQNPLASAKTASVRQHPGGSIKVVPAERSMRELIRREAQREAERIDSSFPLTRSRLEKAAEAVLGRLHLPRDYLGWTMVAVGSAFWQPQVMGVPYQRRLLLLPHCMRNVTVCAASYSASGLQCFSCGGCSLGWLSAMAQSRGYRVLIAEGSPAVMKLILSGEADALLGVACLNSLERALEKVLTAGIPCMAVPLLMDQCRETTTDEDWILEMIETPFVAQASVGRSYLPLMRLAVQIVRKDLEELLPRSFFHKEFSKEDSPGPLGVTEDIAYGYLTEGGKYYRPFVALGTYDALKGAYLTRAPLDQLAEMPPDIRGVALAVEIFHKASLIHDDIEDGDRYRYGRATLHERWGVPIALNTGDFLIGLGYAALHRAVKDAETLADLLEIFSRGHLELCAGQGAELWLSRNPLEPVRVPEILRIYALKSGPAFEVSALAGLRLAGTLPPWAAQIRRFSRAFGIAFQVQNDLLDWEAQEENKKVLGADALAKRPTLLWALGWHLLGERFSDLVADTERGDVPSPVERVRKMRSMFEQAGIFATAERILQKQRENALAAAEAIPHEELRMFLQYLAESALRLR